MGVPFMSLAACHRSFSQSLVDALVTALADARLPRTDALAGRPAESSLGNTAGGGGLASVGSGGGSGGRGGGEGDDGRGCFGSGDRGRANSIEAQNMYKQAASVAAQVSSFERKIIGTMLSESDRRGCHKAVM
jgi:hypothetical protein